jgi:hypothetical protein
MQTRQQNPLNTTKVPYTQYEERSSGMLGPYHSTALQRGSPSRPAQQWHTKECGRCMWARLHSLLSPHFTTQLRVQPGRAVKVPTRRSSDRKRASAALRVEERHDHRGTNAVWAWGSPPWVRRAPRKFGWWGAKQVEAKNTPLTISAFSFPQFTHILSRIFFTLTMNPKVRK